ncbi:hypothetical protein, partial [uncultured Cyclobacterium sp.]|uniref:hypothetical protein n=1 Tax=uncultured Cyclobacterium sp. TaxID=453820 RepID=UPI0030ECB1BF
GKATLSIQILYLISALFKDVISDIYMYRIISYLQLERRNEACSDVKKLLIIDPSLKDELLGICFNNEDDTEKTSQYDFKIPGKVGRLKTNGRKIKKGEEIQIVASGSVVFGMFAGSASPNGFTNGAFKSYNILGGANHGALLFRIGQGDWYFVGTEMTIISKDEGDMQFLINDADASNNSGEFKVQVRIK